MTDCVHCERDCPACRWPINAGWVHVTQRQGQLVLCNVRRVPPAPLVDALMAWMRHVEHSRPVRTVAASPRYL